MVWLCHSYYLRHHHPFNHQTASQVVWRKLECLSIVILHKNTGSYEVLCELDIPNAYSKSRILQIYILMDYFFHCNTTLPQYRNYKSPNLPNNGISACSEFWSCWAVMAESTPNISPIFNHLFWLLHRWEIGKWNTCSLTCGVGLQTRDVFCSHLLSRESNETVILADELCHKPKPSLVQACNRFDCPPSWYTTEWQEVRMYELISLITAESSRWMHYQWVVLH